MQPEKPLWNYSKAGKPAVTEPRLETAPKTEPPPSKPAHLNPSAKPGVVPAVSSKPVPSNASSASLPIASIMLQVAALRSHDDAQTVMTSLRKKHFNASVQTSTRDHLYHVQVGPFADQKSADAAKKGLDSAGFKAFIVKH